MTKKLFNSIPIQDHQSFTGTHRDKRDEQLSTLTLKGNLNDQLTQCVFIMSE